MEKRAVLVITNIVALAGVLVVNFLANALPINGRATGDISDKFDVLFKPAGYAFSIWGLIYLGLIAFVIYQALPAHKESGLIDRVSFYFILSCLANMAWLFAWHHEKFALTVVLMFILLASLIAVYTRLNINMADISVGEKWAVHIPFRLYLGWICVATLANVTIYLAAVNWNGWGLSQETWFLLILLLGLILLSVFAFRRRDVVPGIVILWAYVAVAVNNAGASPLVSTSSWAASVLALIILAVGVFSSLK